MYDSLEWYPENLSMKIRLQSIHRILPSENYKIAETSISSHSRTNDCTLNIDDIDSCGSDSNETRRY